MTNQADDAAKPSDTPAAHSGAADALPEPQRTWQRAGKDIIDLFLRKPLYKKIEGNQDYVNAVDAIIDGLGSVDFDNYCIFCDRTTPWTVRKYNPKTTGGGVGSPGPRYVQPSLPKIRVVHAVCMRRQHFYTYVLHVEDGVIQKIGQKPSMADIALQELKTIPGINSEDRSELGRALGLFAHDTPLGAFVYLRRVFERMIARAHEGHKTKFGDVQSWNELRMGERIAALADELPEVVRSNSGVWSLLSKGIHELSDEDAQALFPLVREVIFEMLSEEERHRQAAIQSVATRKALAGAVARFRSSPPDDDGSQAC